MAKGLLLIFAIAALGFFFGFATAHSVILKRNDCTSQQVFEKPNVATESAVPGATSSAHK